MIKCDFDLDFTLDLQRTFGLLSGQFEQVTFEPERYCAVKVIVPTPDGRGVTVCIFHTGKAFASGRNSVSEVSEAFAAVSGTLLLHRDSLFAPADPKRRNKRRQADEPVEDPPCKRVGGAEDLWSELLEAAKPASSALEIPLKLAPLTFTPTALAPAMTAAMPMWQLPTLATQAA
mmetsp:Transcript_35702/g.77186  ORF Transcript_35702/g.77186 Transcript_35702/m.77186 type:complete len:175 (-) Transcript_35702:359-883(-)